MEPRDAYNLLADEHNLPEWDKLTYNQQDSLARDWETSLEFALDDFAYHAKRIIK